MPCGSQINSVFCRTLSKSPMKWSMDQLCNSNTQNKAHMGISSVYHHYPNSPHPNEMNSKNSPLPPTVWVWAHGTEEAITNASEAAMMDGIHTGQSWRWLISLWSQRSESQPMWQRWGETWMDEPERCRAEHSSHNSLMEMWGCNAVCILSFISLVVLCWVA